MFDEKNVIISTLRVITKTLSEAAHFISKTSFPTNWILGATGIIGLFYTGDGVVHVGDVMVVFMNKQMSKRSKSSVLT